MIAFLPDRGAAYVSLRRCPFEPDVKSAWVIDRRLYHLKPGWSTNPTHDLAGETPHENAERSMTGLRSRRLVDKVSTAQR